MSNDMDWTKGSDRDIGGCLFAGAIIAGLAFLVSMMVLAFIVVILELTGVFCADMWSDFGYQYSWTGGCKVQTESGFVPEENVRITSSGEIVIDWEGGDGSSE